nr:zinc finger, CCHC-type [Tanacetum cinerariifolium]
MMKNMFGLRWNCRELKGIMKLRFFRNMGFNESEEYKKTFIGSGVGTGSIQVLHGFEFEVEPLGDHTFEVEPQENVDQGAGLQEMCMYSATVAGNAVTTAMAINGSIHKAIKGLLDKAKGNVLGMEIVRDWSRDCDMEKNGKWSCIYAVGSQEYQMVCTRLDIASADVGMLDKFNRGLQTDVQVFVDFDYAMGRSITRYGFMILGCAGSLKANLQHMEALPTTEAGYMTFTEAWKKKMWLKRLLTESRYKLRLVAGIATGALVKGGSWSEVLAQVEVAAYRY